MDIKKLVVLISIFDYAIGIELFTKLKDYLAIFTSYQPNEWYTPEWIDYNHTALKEILKNRVYGQHLAEAIPEHLQYHIKNNPTKALTLSFHGGSGTGKSYVSKIIARSIYKDGLKSKCVHLIPVPYRFPHGDMDSIYKERVRELVEIGVNECPCSLFIFEDINAMSSEVFDSLKPYLQDYEDLNGIDYRKSIFIFISNTAAENISEIALNQWNSSLKREDIGLKEIEKVISTTIINKKESCFYNSEIIFQHMISAYVPFFPMERKHVKECIKDFLVAKGFFKKKEEIPETKISDIAGELNYYPENEQVFSLTGCKRIEDKMVLFMKDDDDGN